MYFEDCAELLKNKHSYRKHVDKFIEYLKEIGLENRLLRNPTHHIYLS